MLKDGLILIWGLDINLELALLCNNVTSLLPPPKKLPVVEFIGKFHFSSVCWLIGH